jgi:2-polyprenyl-6-methoxyphenol hydroxylase-like FAD-dependent oxidoreductase
MQPNLGQGGCMAIEDGYELSKLLGEALQSANNVADSVQVSTVP